MKTEIRDTLFSMNRLYTGLRHSETLQTEVHNLQTDANAKITNKILESITDRFDWEWKIETSLADLPD